MNQLYSIIKQKIKENNGEICFKEFMSLCLYHPLYGYYADPDRIIGRRGDYYTNVSVGNLFGRLLACEFLRWFVLKNKNGRFKNLYLIEAGAHDGRLADDILSWLKEHYPDFHNVKYVILEPLDSRRNRQKKILQRWWDRIVWVRDFDTFEEDAPRELSSFEDSYQILFSNELLDALPFHRLMWVQDWFDWREIGVSLEHDNFKFKLIRLCEECKEFKKHLENYSDFLGRTQEKFILEYPSDAINWWKKACRFIHTGRLVAMDFGFITPDLLCFAYPQGTMRCYYKHHLSCSPLEYVGEQDITASVNFQYFVDEAEALGLKTYFYGPQQRFLVDIVRKNGITERTKWFRDSIEQFNTLIHPDFLGQVFKVLVMDKKGGLAVEVNEKR